MIKIQNFRTMMLSCHIGTISILTDKEYIDVDISTTETGKLLSERYYATDGRVLWELVSAYTETGTAFPNFGSSEYVTGIRDNTRTSVVNFVFKRISDGKEEYKPRDKAKK